MSAPIGRSTRHPGWAESRNPTDRECTLSVGRSTSRVRGTGRGGHGPVVDGRSKHGLLGHQLVAGRGSV